MLSRYDKRKAQATTGFVDLKEKKRDRGIG
jgi:hypothetical protein